MISLLLLPSLYCSVAHKYLQNADAAYVKSKPESRGPSLNDPNLKVEIVFKNSDELDLPITSMAFLGHDDILVLEKNKGTVRRIVKGEQS